MNIYAVDWYPHFGRNSAIIRALEIAMSEKVKFVDRVEIADVILIGPYGDQHKYSHIVHAKQAWKLFCTAENVLPDYRYYDHSLTFSRFNFNNRNYRWPCWHHSLALDQQCQTTYTYDETLHLLHVNRPLVDVSEKEHWSKIVAIFSNMESIRCHLYTMFDQQGLIDGIGGPFGNAFAWGDEFTYRSKLAALKPYGFNMCLENTISDGYYTEKVLHARSSGCIAIVYSESHINNDFHGDGIVNLYDYDTVDNLVADIMSLASDRDDFIRRASSPIFSTKPELYGAVNFIRESYGNFIAGTLDTKPIQFSNSTLEIRPPSKVMRLLKQLRTLIS